MPRRPAPSLLALLAVALLPAGALACNWDYDTLKMERARFPGTLELVTGKFLRHSPEFYRWRIDNRLKRLEADPANLALLDDLAVAYDKTGRHDLAIETAQRADALRPNRYETAANLGTFHFHAGRLREGLPHIGRALAVNSDAHFGREKYQKLLAEYVLERDKGTPPALPLCEVGAEGQATHTFADFVGTGDDAAAIRGVLGMMKFGRHDSPVLLEALASLLTRGESNPSGDAKRLAARAYLKASYGVDDENARRQYRQLATRSLEMQLSGSNTIEQVEADFRAELADAEAWYADLRQRELGWIAAGTDPEAEFDKLYDAEPESPGNGLLSGPWLTSEEGMGLCGALGCGGPLLAVAAGAAYWWRRRRRRRA